MSVTVVTTVGGASSNSYVSVADASTYFNGRLDASAWTSAASTSPETQTTALVMAARRLDQEKYRGRVASSTQALQWPRYDVEDRNGYEVSSTSIPQEVKDAQCEMALALLEDNDLLNDTGLEGFERVKVGPVEVEPRATYTAGGLPDDVRRELSHYLAGSAHSFRFERG